MLSLLKKYPHLSIAYLLSTLLRKNYQQFQYFTLYSEFQVCQFAVDVEYMKFRDVYAFLNDPTPVRFSTIYAF